MLTNHLKKIKSLKSLNALIIISLLFILSACSPHPGAGNWKADSSNSLNISTINIIFEGNADFYVEGKEDSIRRCFWSAVGQQKMEMQCVHAEDTDKKVKYQFVVTEKGHARLTEGEQLISTFTLQAPEKEASFF